MPRTWIATCVAVGVLAGTAREAHLSGATSGEHKTAHFALRMTSGPSISFARPDDEQRHHAEEREKLKPRLEHAGRVLETALADGVDARARALVEPFAAGPPTLEWSVLQSEADRTLDQYGYSPYAEQLLKKARARTAGAPFDKTWDAILAKSFILELRHEMGDASLTTQLRIAGKPARADLERLVTGLVTRLRPSKRLLRIARGGKRTPESGAIEEEDRGAFVVRTNRVVVRLAKPGPAVATGRDLARRVARRLEGELATVADQGDEFDRTFELALKKGGYRVATAPSGGMSTVWLAEVPAEIELAVQLRTVENDNGGGLDRVIVERMYELCKAELPGLKRHDSPRAIDEIGPTDWVLARIPN